MTDLSLQAVVQRDAFRLSVELDVSAGEVVGLSGDIGSGKSSVLMLASGRLVAAEGRVAYGRQVWDEPSTGTFVAERPVSLLSQAYVQDLPEDQTGVEIVAANVAKLATPDGAPSPELVARQVLADLGVGDHVVDRLPWTYSGAEAQRIALARAIAPRPPVVLLDEPFGSLDKRTGAAVRAWLAEWLRGFDGVAIIACSRLEHLEPLTDRIHHI